MTNFSYDESIKRFSRQLRGMGLDEALREQEEIEITIVSEMKRALENGEFKIYLQPKVDMRTGEIIGSEALVRWVHPEKGVISPGRFVPVFERNGLISDVDRYMWEQACVQLRKWKINCKKTTISHKT